MNNDLAAPMCCEDCSRTPRIGIESNICSWLSNSRQPHISSNQLMLTSSSEVSTMLARESNTNPPIETSVAPIPTGTGVKRYDVPFANLSDQNQSASHGPHTLLPLASILTPSSSCELSELHICETDTTSSDQYPRMNSTSHSTACSRETSCSNALHTQAADSLFTDTMRVLLQSNSIPLDSTGDFYDNSNDKSSKLPNELSITQESLDNSSFKRQRMTPCNSFSILPTENDNESVQEIARTSTVLPTLRSLLESGSSEVLTPASTEHFCSASPHTDPSHQMHSLTEAPGLRSTMPILSSVEPPSIASQKCFSMDSNSSLDSFATLTSSRSCSQSPMTSSFYDHGAAITTGGEYFDVNLSSAERDPCVNFENEDTQSSVIRRYGNLQLGEAPLVPVENPVNSQLSPTVGTGVHTSCSPIVLQNVVGTKFFLDEGESCSLSIPPDSVMPELSVDANDPTHSPPFDRRNELNHVSSFTYLQSNDSNVIDSHLPTTDCNSPHPSRAKMPSLDGSCQASSHDLLGIPMARTTEPQSIVGTAISSDGHPIMLHVEKFPMNVANSATDNATPPVNSMDRVTEHTSILAETHEAPRVSVRSAPQTYNTSQLIVTKKIRPPRMYHRHVASVGRMECPTRECSNSLGASGLGAGRRLNSITNTRGRPQLQPSHTPPNTASANTHTNRQCYASNTRTPGGGYRASLLQCSINARKRSNRCAGFGNPYTGTSFVGVTPCVRRKYNSSAHRSIASYYPHSSAHRATVSTSSVTGLLYPDSIRPNVAASHSSDTVRSHQTARVIPCKLASTLSASLRHPCGPITGRTGNVAATTPFSSIPSLHQALPDYSSAHQCRIQVVRQPEAQHRARYQTEGSRGAVKDRNGSGYPTVQLIGWNGQATLQVFVASESGRVRPHPFYQAYLVAGKSTKYCIQTIRDGVNVIEMPFTCADDWTVSVECVGILKLRKSDVEHRAQANLSLRQRQSDAQRGATSSMSTSSNPISKLGTRRQGRARLVFRAILSAEGEPNLDVIQVASEPILCTQLIGDPEICRISLTEAPATGGQDLFILGKNLGKDCQIWFRQVADTSADSLCLPQATGLTVPGTVLLKELIKLETVTTTGTEFSKMLQPESANPAEPESTVHYAWQTEAVVELEFSHQTHLVCRVPAYTGPSAPLKEPLEVELVVSSGERSSQPHPFTYCPVAGGPESDRRSPPISFDTIVPGQQFTDSYPTEQTCRSHKTEVEPDSLPTTGGVLVSVCDSNQQTTRFANNGDCSRTIFDQFHSSTPVTDAPSPAVYGSETVPSTSFNFSALTRSENNTSGSMTSIPVVAPPEYNLPRVSSLVCPSSTSLAEFTESAHGILYTPPSLHY